MADGFVLPGNDPLLTETTLLALVCGSQIAGASSEEPDELQSSLADGLRQAALALLDISIMDDAAKQRHAFSIVIPLCGVIADAVGTMDDLYERKYTSSFERRTEKPNDSAALQVSDNPSDPLNMRRLEIKALRELLSEQLFERENLVNIELKDIESAYMRELGVLEAELYRAQSEARLLKRRLELMQACINRQEPIREAEINETIRREQAEFDLKYETIAQKIRDAYYYELRRRQQESGVSKNDAQEDPEEERRRLYRKIVKAMHPDLHPNQTQEQKDLFLRAIDAYKNFDLDTLRQIAAMLDDDTPEQADDPEQALVREVERLLDLVRGIRLGLQGIRSRYPYTKKALLEDPVRLAEEKEKLREQLDDAEKQSDIYRKRIEELRRMYG